MSDSTEKKEISDSVKPPTKKESESFFVKSASLIDRCHKASLLLGPAGDAYKLVTALSQTILGKSDNPMKNLALSFEHLYNNKSTKKEVISILKEWKDTVKKFPGLNFKDIKKSPKQYQKYFVDIIKATIKTAKKLSNVLKEVNKKVSEKGNAKSR